MFCFSGFWKSGFVLVCVDLVARRWRRCRILSFHNSGLNGTSIASAIPTLTPPVRKRLSIAQLPDVTTP